MRGDRTFNLIHAKLELSKRRKEFEKANINFVRFLDIEPFRRLTIGALQAELFDGKSNWPARALVEEALDEWLLEASAKR